jgi:hypothetical protein
MKTLRDNAMMALLASTLLGCAETTPIQTTTTTTTVTKTTQTSRVVSLTIGMNGSDAIALAGIPCSPETLKSINDGNNVTINYGGHAYVFSKGVLEAVR